MKCHSFDFSEADLKSAYRLHARTTLTAQIVTSAIVFIIFASPALLKPTDSPITNALFVAIGLAAAAYFIFTGQTGKTLLVTTISVPTKKLLCQPTTICWDEKIIEFSNVSGNVKLEWAIFESWKANSTNLILYRGNNLFNYAKFEGEGSADTRDHLIACLSEAGVKGRLFT